MLLVVINMINYLIPGIINSTTHILQLQKLIRVNIEFIPRTISPLTLTNLFMLIFVVGTVSLYLIFLLGHLSTYPISLSLFWWFFIPISTFLILRFLLNIALARLYHKRILLIEYINSRIPIHFSICMAILMVCFIHYTVFKSLFFLLISGGGIITILIVNEVRFLQKLAKENAIKKFYMISYICILRLLPLYGVFEVSVAPLLE